MPLFDSKGKAMDTTIPFDQKLGDLRQVKANAISFYLQVNAQAIRSLPEQVTISRSSETADKASYLLAFTQQEEGIDGLAELLQGITELLKNLISSLNKQPEDQETNPS